MRGGTAAAVGGAAEVVDIVNREDSVIGVALRSHMRRYRLLHRAVYILVFNPAGQLLIHQRTPSKDIFPSYWDVAFGGVVEAGESYDDAAVRELAEEAGVNEGGKLESLFQVGFADDVCPVLGRAYRIETSAQLRFQRTEVATTEWIDVADVERRAEHDRFCPDGIAVWHRYRSAV